MAKKYGYARVSSKEQNEKRQLIALSQQEIEPQNIYVDKQSGKDFARPQYIRLIKRLKPNDILFIHSIDRLGRNYEEIIEQWRYLTSSKRVSIVVIDMPLLDTRQQVNDLTGVFISNLVLQILSYVAQTERENIHKRQAEGIAAAKARGVSFGRKSKNPPENFWVTYKKYKKHRMTGADIAKHFGISRSLLYRWISRYTDE